MNTIIDYSIEKGNVDNIDELEILYNELNDFLSDTINYPGWLKGIYPIRETAEKAISEGTLYILRKEGIIAGSIVLNHEPEEAYAQADWGIESEYQDILVIHTLVVHPKFLNQGIGRQLMMFAKEVAFSSGIKALRLDVSKDNIPAIRLYNALGYTYIGTVDLGLPYDHLKWFQLYEYIF